nr:highly divergent homeobox-like [Paramormyrops kingsleyae]
MDGEGSSALADNVKIEIIDDEDEEEDNDDEVIGPDVDLVHSQLEFKQEEVRYLESELENQKQKYYKLQMFTKNLLSAVKNMDQEKQQVGTFSRALDQCGVTVTRQGDTLGRMPVCFRAQMHYG